MKRVLIALLTLGFLCIVFLFYSDKDVVLVIINESKQESVFIEVFWDENKVFSDSVIQIKTFPGNKFNTSFGKHNLKIIANGIVENQTVSVFFKKYIFIDYNGNPPEWNSEKPIFVVTEKNCFNYD